MARGLVYTAIMGGYDKPKPVRVQEDGVDYVMATDGPGAGGWQVKQPRLVRIKADCRELARRVKVAMPVGLSDEYDWTMWVDGTMEIVGPVKAFAEKALEKHDFAAWRHPWWQCSYTEVDKCIAMKKDSRFNLERGRSLLKKGGLPKNHGQLATWVLLRKNTSMVEDHARLWWRDMKETTMRDQVTFMLNLWRCDAKIQWLPGTVDSTKWLKFHRGHKK